ncbi:nucleoid-associated protein [Halomonas urumqiensis]|uniref:Nucleoid-associated protein YejK n=1 Tax=Halomonas urumqiensis TaxID=1684789 RepID=A0A2N7UQV4_9GAMM|nr:nucleoid-associated protein [Halomonas urumqiensis]PMR82814.1 nucleoid-associated protein YejK [Halomonas urumqiensis]PTB01867.1 nucleoid-associated protein YejK [Halomonas urumqiensis]GHE21970.1 nucleoid-associated protein [Halomonas urumqiensis]
MPIHHSIIHRIVHPADTGSDDASGGVVPSSTELTPSEHLDALLEGVNKAFHAKNKSWGHFAGPGDDAESSALPAELRDYLEGNSDFSLVTRQWAERVAKLVAEHLSLSGDLLFLDYQFGDTRYLSLALLHHREGFCVDDAHRIVPARQLNLAQMSLAARLNISQWQADGASKQYLSWTRDRGGKKLAEGFAALLGAIEGVDASGETRTLLKAFSDYVEKEDLPEDASREKTDALIDYASEHASRGEPITLEALSEVLDEREPRAFFDHIRQADYGLSPEIPPDKRTLNQFRRFAGRAGGVSISFDSHLLGSSIEYDEAQDRLIIKQVPKQLKEQLKRQG